MRYVLVMICCVLTFPLSVAQDNLATDGPRAATTDVIEVAKAGIKEVSGSAIVDGKDVELEAIGPVYAFGEPAFKIASGTLWVWTRKGISRPDALMSLATITASRCFEFHSFSDQPLKFNLFNRTWEPKAAWSPIAIPNAPEAANTEQRRLSQMKLLIERFRSEEYVPPLKKFYAMRILPTPIYRYPNSTQKSDGGLFVIGRDGDPEAILILEAIDAKWHFMAARLTSHLPKVSLDNTEYVLEDKIGPSETYFYTFRAADTKESPFKR